MRKLVIATVVASLGATAVAVADPDAPNIRPHRHFVQNDQGLVQVGPRVCDNPDLQRAFNQFHTNVHIKVEDSPGPEHSAPGLHDFKGGEITARSCAFVAP